MSDEETIAAYNATVDDYVNITADAKANPPLFDAFAEGVVSGGRVLDLGCGPGDASEMLAARGFDVQATDASAEMVKLANSKPGVSAHQATFDHIEGDGIYDGVWASFSLLHALRADFPTHLRALHKAMKEGATLYLAMKLGEGEKRDRLGRHYAYYSEAEFESILADCGFKISQSQLGEALGMVGGMEPNITILAKRLD